MNEYKPSFDDFVERSKLGNVIPVYREILADMETPVSAYLKVAGLEPSFLLESVTGGERIGRFSFVGSGASAVIQSKDNTATVTRDGINSNLTLNPGHDVLHVLSEILSQVDYVPNPNLPKFCGGAVGYIGYDVVRFFEELPNTSIDDLNIPDCVMLLVDTLLVFDHVSHRIRIVHNAHVGTDPQSAYQEAITKIEEIASKLAQPLNYTSPQPCDAPIAVRSNFKQQDFEQSVERCKEYIAAGDAIQIVLSQRFEADITARPFDIYRALRGLNPSPYMYYLSLGELALVGSSPEILVTVEGETVTTRPIAGTRPRGNSEAEDTLLEAELLKDEKERAEHVMLVDLGRNDIGRVCEYGSVSVDELMGIERYSHVMHIVSNVTGRLKSGMDQFDVLRACFPAGTVSGAPKIRAMQIIDELEPTRRATYAGAIGYFSYSGDMDTAITIRTILIKDDKAYVQAGAGIVADSVPETEFIETRNKAGALISAIEAAENGLR